MTENPNLAIDGNSGQRPKPKPPAQPNYQADGRYGRQCWSPNKVCRRENGQGSAPCRHTPNPDVHRGSARFEQYAGNFSPAHQHSFGHFIDTAPSGPMSEETVSASASPATNSIVRPFRLNAPGLINGGHQISLRRLPHPPRRPRPALWASAKIQCG